MPSLGPATLHHPLSDGIPPNWASAWGEDDYGPWVEIHVGEAQQSLRWIPPGTFLMGSPDSETVRLNDEGPQQPVTISRGFWLFDTPCTQALWEAVMGENPSHFQGPQRPVESVSWEDCQRFIDSLNSSLPDLQLALPTEAEWEYACRATTQRSTYIGDLTIDGNGHAKGLEDIAWYTANADGETHPVGELQPNDFGLYDMLGNVWEWCRDNYPRKYATDHVTDAVHLAGDSSAARVLRGGSWDDSALLVRRRPGLAPLGTVTSTWAFAAPVQGGELGQEAGMRREEPERSGRSRRGAGGESAAKSNDRSALAMPHSFFLGRQFCLPIETQSAWLTKFASALLGKHLFFFARRRNPANVFPFRNELFFHSGIDRIGVQSP